MPVTTPPSVTALPTPPQRSDPVNFPSRGDAFLAALPTFQTETNAVAANVAANATDAASNSTASAASAAAALASQTAAAASAQAAAASAGASIWVSGTTYTIGDARWSPLTRYVYRRITNGAGTTDPSADATNWALAGGTSPQLVVVSGTSQAAQAGAHYVLTNVAATTVTLQASPSVGDEVWVSGANGLTTNVVARNGNKIHNVSEDMTLIYANETAQLRYEGASFGWRLLNV
jgi:hypothetical protein